MATKKKISAKIDKKSVYSIIKEELGIREQDGFHMQQSPLPDGQQAPMSQMPVDMPTGQFEEMSYPETSDKKKYEITYVPFNEIPGNLQKSFNDGSLSPEEYAARLEPFYRTTYGEGGDEEEAILSLGNDFEDQNEVVGATEKFQYVAEAGQNFMETKASMVVMSHLSDVQEATGNQNNIRIPINFVKYIIAKTHGDLNQDIDADQLWEEFSKTRYAK